jgi:hypothetical protein
LKEGMLVEVQHNGTWQQAKVVGARKETTRAGKSKQTKIVGWTVALKKDNLHLPVKAADLRPCSAID